MVHAARFALLATQVASLSTSKLPQFIMLSTKGVTAAAAAAAQMMNLASACVASRYLTITDQSFEIHTATRQQMSTIIVTVANS